MTVTRVKSFKTGLVKAPIDDVWDLLMDFAGTLRWWPTPAEGGRPGPNITRVDLIGDPNSVPRTRRINLETGAIVDETLLYEDRATRRLYYDMEPQLDAQGNAFRGAIRGYLCVTTLEAQAPGSTRMTFEATFDVMAPADPDEQRLAIEGIHEKAILNGFNRYFA
jgi:hypothetical protein